MIAVIFEVQPHPHGRQPYLDLAASLRTDLEQIDGFISVERFESLTNPGKMLALSFFRDEDSLAAWRNVEAHRRAQAQGQKKLFADYRIRIANVVRDYSMTDREQVPEDSLAVHGG